MLNEAERRTLSDAKHWLQASLCVCELLILDDETVDDDPQTYLLTVAEAQHLLPLVLRHAPVALATLERYLQRLPQES